jgi:hypothetical protein
MKLKYEIFNAFRERIYIRTISDLNTKIFFFLDMFAYKIEKRFKLMSFVLGLDT